MSDSVSTFFFPLRTNVQYFTTPKGFLSLEGRIKQALILYDQIVFESGLYIVTMGPDGTFDTHFPATQLPRHSDQKTVAIPSSGHFSVWAQPSGSPEPFQKLYSSAIERNFQAEFHTLFNKLTNQFGVKELEISDIQLSRNGERLAALSTREYLNKEGALLPDGSEMLQRQIVQNLFKDLVLASALGYASGMDPLHAPMLDQIVRRTEDLHVAPGFSALKFQVPHFAALPWEQIVQVRAEPAIIEFRKRLFEAENTVRYMLPEASENDIQLEVGKILHRELIQETRAKMAPSGRKLAGNVTAQVAGGILPPPLSTIQTALSAGKTVADSVQERRSWLTVLWKLSRIA